MRHVGVLVLAALGAACAPVDRGAGSAGRGEAVTKAAEPTAAGVPAALDREWAVFELGGEAVTGRSPTIGFGDGRVFGFAGCNRYTGPVGFTGGDGIRVGAAAMTMMACPEPMMALEQRFAKALEAVSRWRVADGVLELLGADGRVVARARAAPPAS